ncbi:MAG: hypothetical protein Ct9H300mP4_16340 [Gammaproteobacteria bacterium]|nr:MAG: hypothetical protein Ct9H300mP4_16340 [Gammaproteobacteria bacterium]
MTKISGGTVEVKSGSLTGSKLIISADPNPNRPESYTWDNRWRPSTDKNPNTTLDAVRAINEYDEIFRFFRQRKR